MVDEKLYISGGSRNGRYLSDIQVLDKSISFCLLIPFSPVIISYLFFGQVFDLKTLAWSTMNLSTELNADKTKESLPQEVLLSSSGHSMVRYGGRIFLF